VLQNIIKDFKGRFSNAKYDAISHPEGTNGLYAIHIFSPEDAVFFPVKAKEESKLGGKFD
jgi:hypothetical protein